MKTTQILHAIVTLGAVALVDTAMAETREKAPTLRYSSPMLPFVYGYAACLHEQPLLPAPQQVSRCREVRLDLREQAEAILPEWYSGPPDYSLELLGTVFDGLESELVYARTHREPVPAEISAYLECTSDYLLGRDGYVDGLYIEFGRADDFCRDAVKDAWNEPTRKLSRDLYRQIDLDGLYRAPLPGGGPWIGGRVRLRTDRHGLLNPSSER